MEEVGSRVIGMLDAAPGVLTQQIPGPRFGPGRSPLRGQAGMARRVRAELTETEVRVCGRIQRIKIGGLGRNQRFEKDQGLMKGGGRFLMRSRAGKCFSQL